MKMKLFNFSDYVAESLGFSDDEFEKMSATSKRLEFLLNTGLIDQSGYNEQIRGIVRTFYKKLKGQGLTPREGADIETLRELGQKTGFQALTALSTDGAQALVGQGLHMVSSPTQLANGNLVWSLDPNYRASDGWGIGFFPSIKSIRRMTPNGVNLGVRWGQPGSMDIIVKRWPYNSTMTTAAFYNTAMLWAADNIDFEDVKRKPGKNEWKYYAKRTTAQRGFDAKKEAETSRLNRLK
jgi:hypothetical protein